MPTTRTRRSRARTTYSQAVVEHLLTGATKQLVDRDKRFHLLFDHRERRAAAWAALRGDILPAWVREHPGTRPWAWWLVEAGQEPPESPEAQRAYLEARGLLTPAEKRALAR